MTVETVAGVAAGVLLSRRRNLAVGLAMCLLGATTAQAQGIPADRIASLPALIDAAVPKLLEQQHIAGTAVAVVHDGRVLMLRGYGRARLNPDVPVDPERTLFRVGSVTKVFTSVAALQLVDAGKVDLHQDIRAYVPDVQARYGATLHQLLTHTAGFGERFAGAYTDAAHLVPLAEHLRRSPPEQVMPPGRVYSYSNYNYGAGRAGDRGAERRDVRPLSRRPRLRAAEDDLEHGASAAASRSWRRSSRAAIAGPAIVTEPVDYTLHLPEPGGRARDHRRRHGALHAGAARRWVGATARQC